jgi:hypothetical protein
VIEHRAIPGAAYGKRERRQQPGTWTADGTRGRPDRGNTADTDQPRQQMTDRVRVERQKFLQPDGNDVEQTAVKIKISEVEDRLIGQAAGVIANDQLTVTLLHLLIVGDAVIAESKCNETGQRNEDERRCEIVGVDARQPPASFEPQPGQRPDAPIEIPSGKLSRCLARQFHWCHFSDSPHGDIAQKTPIRATPSSKLT